MIRKKYEIIEDFYDKTIFDSVLLNQYMPSFTLMYNHLKEVSSVERAYHFIFKMIPLIIYDRPTFVPIIKEFFEEFEGLKN